MRRIRIFILEIIASEPRFGESNAGCVLFEQGPGREVLKLASSRRRVHLKNVVELALICLNPSRSEKDMRNLSRPRLVPP
jgi:hypothetical protein